MLLGLPPASARWLLDALPPSTGGGGRSPAAGHRPGTLAAFMRAGAQAGATTMFLTTGEANAAARALYDSLGGGLATEGPTVNYWFRLNR